MTPRASASSPWLMFSILRRIRTRLPTCLSTGRVLFGGNDHRGIIRMEARQLMSSICALWQCQGMPVASGEPRLATDRCSGADVIRWSWGLRQRANHPRDRRRRPVTYVTGWASLNEPVGIDTGLPRPWGASANSSMASAGAPVHAKKPRKRLGHRRQCSGNANATNDGRRADPHIPVCDSVRM